MNKKLLLLFVFCSVTTTIFSSFNDGNNSSSSESIEDVGGITPLMKAARDGDLAEVEKLVQQGDPVDASDDNNFTAFTYAFIADKPNIAKFLQSEMGKLSKKNDLPTIDY